MRTFLFFCLIVALFLPAAAQYPEVTIQEIQTVLDPEDDDHSPLEGDTIVVEGVVMSDARSLWGGARWGLLIEDPDGGPWSGVQIIQHDTLEAGTLLTAVDVGFTVKFTGLVEEFSYDPDVRVATQVALLTNPPVPIQITGTADLPEPEIVTCEDLNAMATGEQWEEVFIKIENAVMVNSDLGSGQALIQDDTGFQLVIEDWFNDMRDSLAAGTYVYPPNGSRFDIVGFVRDLPAATGYAIAMRNSSDIHLQALAPVVEDFQRDATAPGPADDVTVEARIYDLDGTVEGASIWYMVDEGPFTEVAMTTPGDSMYFASIPATGEEAVVTYYLSAIDNAGNEITFPDTSSFFALYHVLEGDLGIYHVQWTPYGDGDFASGSPYEGYEVEITGTVMTDTTYRASSYYIQDGDEPWHGILVMDGMTLPNVGDQVRVRGLVEEYFDLTRISPADPSVDVEIIGTNDAYDPILKTTGELNTDAGLMAEMYEDMLMRVENVEVTTAFPDAPGNYGEFAIDDGTGELRVDDYSWSFDGNLDSTYVEGMQLNFVQGFLDFTFSNFKLQPRSYDDVEDGTSGDQNPVQPAVLRLHAPQPNPGSNNFMLAYDLPYAANINLAVFDLAGHRVRSLQTGLLAAGSHITTWDGMDDRGLSVSAGVYVCRLKAGETTRTQRLVVIR